jgi:hypothetical protein
LPALRSIALPNPALRQSQALPNPPRRRRNGPGTGATGRTRSAGGGRKKPKRETNMADAAIQGHGHQDTRGFFTRWFMSTNHKDIGILYLFTSALVGFIAVAFTVYMRMELMHPGVQFMCMEPTAPRTGTCGTC